MPPPQPPIQIPATPARKPKRKASPPRGRGYRLPPDQPGNESRERNNGSGFVPFTGRAQRLPDDNPGSNLRANAIQRMRELGHQGEQARRGREMVDRMGDLGRALRRGGARGDVVPLGKRKRNAEAFAPNPRKRIGDRPAGPQQFTIAT